MHVGPSVPRRDEADGGKRMVLDMADEAAAKPGEDPSASGTRGGWLRRVLGRTRQTLGERLGSLFQSSEVTQETYETLEEVLLSGDVGMAVTERLVAQVRSRRPQRGEDLRRALEEAITALLGPAQPLVWATEGLTVWILVGVNGAGKTTTAGKLAAQAVADGRKVILAAADTFRAAAQEQLGLWASRTGAQLIRGAEGGDPAAVAFDAVHAGVARRADLVIVDTAGRLQTKEPLMAELGKISRVIGRELPGAPHEVLLTLDATVGQNALSQARLFGEAVQVTGILLAKMDSSARGGSVLSVHDALGTPIKLVGTGEHMSDLRPFEPALYAQALIAPLTDQDA